jgi:hypothetical protein
MWVMHCTKQDDQGHIKIFLFFPFCARQNHENELILNINNVV